LVNKAINRKSKLNFVNFVKPCKMVVTMKNGIFWDVTPCGSWVLLCKTQQTSKPDPKSKQWNTSINIKRILPWNDIE
jgi:hypothetical protein